jgi:hypothetical protein
MLTEVREPVRRTIERSILGDLLDADAITATLDEALGRLRGDARSRGPWTTDEHPTGRRKRDRSDGR